MKRNGSEIAAIVLTVLAVAFGTVWPFFHESQTLEERLPPGVEVVTLTAVAATGTWTVVPVDGSNYWRTDLPRARPVLRVGKPTLLRLKSADVVHTFYAPGLGVGPVSVEPGHVAELLVTPREEGVFSYYCTTVCGEPHFGMTGVMIVQGNGSGGLPPVVEPTRYWMAEPPPSGASRVARGRWLYERKGCVTCHGEDGRGGVENWNYINVTVPSLDGLAEKMFLFYPEDIEAVVAEIEQGRRLSELEDDPPVPRFGAVLAQYRSIRDVIRKGRQAGIKDPAGTQPPLDMPAWEQRLDGEDIDDIMAYLLTLSLAGGEAS